MTGILQDFRFFFRQTLRRPIWTASIIGVLALGISANTAMYAGFDAWVTRPLPFERPDELVLVQESQPKLGVYYRNVSPAALGDLSRDVGTLEGLEAWDSRYMNIADSAEPARILGASVTHGLFPMLGVHPIHGRHFVTEEDLPSQPARVALIGYRLWAERYESAPNIVGRTIRLSGEVYEIVGVMPEGFRFPSWSDIWIPLGGDSVSTPRDQRTLDVVGRFSRGATLAEARQEVEALGEELARRYPDTNAGYSLTVRPLRDLWVPGVIEVALGTTLAAAFFLLLIVCANVASLMLARASSRSGEIALRTALGASRLRLARQTLVESIVLALIGGLGGVLLTEWWIHAMYTAAPIEPPYLFSMEVNWRISLYTLLVSLIAGVACAIGPLTRSSGAALQAQLRSVGRTGTSGKASALRGLLVAGELTLSTALAIGALLMVKSFLLQQSVNPGYKTDDVVTMELSLNDSEFDDRTERVKFLERLHGELLATGSLRTVASANALPSSDGIYVQTLEAEGRPVEPSERVRAAMTSFYGSYFETLEIPITEGRGFTAGELRGGADVVVVSDSLASQLWPGEMAVGRRIRVFEGEVGAWLRVVGVVGNVERGRDMVAEDVPIHQLYRPYASYATTTATLAAASAGAPEQVADLVRAAVRKAGAAVPVTEVLSMRELISRRQWVTRLFGEQLALYGLIALAIAAVGLYGLVADAVSRRSHEIAIRLAIGAQKQDVVRAFVANALWLALAGTTAGLLVGVAGARMGSTMLVGVSPFDPSVLIGVATILASISVLASYLPARRAASMDPARTLQSE